MAEAPLRLLVVDDERVVQRLLVRTLEKCPGFTVVTASSGVEALGKLAVERFVAVISDVNMPGMSGYELLAAVRARDPSILRVLLSGSPCEPEALGLVHQYWAKPWNADVLVAGLQRAARVDRLVADPRWRALAGDVDALPAAPAIVLRLNRVLADPRAGAAEVAQVIESDPAMAAKVLQLASSAFFGLAAPTVSIDKAVVRLGIEIVRSLATASALFAAITPPHEVLDVAELQSASLAVAQVASQLADALSVRQAAFAAGLLHGIGRLVLAARAPDAYRDVVSESSRADRPLADLELERLGVTDGDIAAYLLGIWGLPDSIVESVGHQHEAVVRGGAGVGVEQAVQVATVLVRTAKDPAFVAQAADLGWLGQLASAERASEWRDLAQRLVTAAGPVRRHPRAAVSWPARLRVGHVTHEGTALDVSVGGAFVAVREALAPGTAVHVTLRLPNGELVTAPATVRWYGRSVSHGAAGVGLELEAEQPALHAFFHSLGRALGVAEGAGPGDEKPT